MAPILRGRVSSQGWGVPPVMRPGVVMVVRQSVSRDGGTVYMASGPDGHEDLLARHTVDAARRDGEAYFLSTRTWDGNRWVISR